MIQTTYYVDSCIWLNLWKEEGDPTKGVPYYLLAQEFIEKVVLSDDKEIVYTGFVLKEIEFKLNDDNLFHEKLEFLGQEPKFRFIKSMPEDYEFARRLESKFEFEICFIDCMHIAISKRLGYILVTRDKLLLEKAKVYILVDKPENLFP